MPRCSLPAAALLLLVGLVCVGLPPSPATALSVRGGGGGPTVWTAPYFTGQLRESGAGWPACDPDVPQWSGYFDIPGKSNGAKHYFYWAFGPRNGNTSAPVILWMTGGPGCSSSFALLTEVGPCWANEETDELDRNPHAWNNEAYLLFVDQPTGVGFSYGEKVDYDVNCHETADDMYNFLKAFFTAHEALRANEFFVVGESYGGHYAPATAHRVMEGNRRKEGPAIRLTGMATGNGLSDAEVQYPAYVDMAYEYCRDRLGAPCVGEAARSEMAAAVPRCVEYIRACNRADNTPAADACRQAGWACNAIPAAYTDTGLNPYDIRKPCRGDMCYDFHAVDAFMNRADVQASLGVDPGILWQSCNMEVNGMFGVDWFKNFTYTVPPLLAAGVRVMVYAGDMDFICNYIGNERWTRQLAWEGQAAFRAAPDVPFTDASGNVVGMIRSVASEGSVHHFSFVRVFAAGHMVPMDQPEAASTLIRKWVSNHRLVP